MKYSLLIAVGLCMVGKPARAQYDDDSLRHTVWVAASMGFGPSHLTCDTCRAGQVVGTDLWVALGGVRNQHIRYALTIDLWSSATTDVVTFALSTYYYPSTRSRLFVGGGLGGSAACIAPDRKNCTTNASGLALTARLGYDLPVKPGLWLTPSIGLTHVAYGDVQSEDATSSNRPPGWQQDVWSFGIGLQWEHKP